MKRVISVSMMFLALLVGFQQAIIVVHFKLNQQIIERDFCVNIAHPEMHCHGNCELKKRLQHTEGADGATVNVYHKVDMLPVAMLMFEMGDWQTVLQNKWSAHHETYYIGPSQEIFVPPPLMAPFT